MVWFHLCSENELSSERLVGQVLVPAMQRTSCHVEVRLAHFWLISMKSSHYEMHSLHGGYYACVLHYWQLEHCFVGKRGTAPCGHKCLTPVRVSPLGLESAMMHR